MNKILTLALAGAAILPAALLATTSTDRKIEAAAKASYNYRTILENRVSVASAEGVVTLTGTVPDRGTKELAQDTVENLPGVVRVDNRIELKSEAPEHSDTWIALKVRGQLLIRANVSAVSTKVDVKDGKVTLSGTVQTMAQKDLTEVDVRDMDDVKSVENNLVVTAPGSSDTSLQETIDDASITAQVKYALLSHRSTSALATKVSTDNAVVSIQGVADSAAEISLVTKLAEDTRGVKSVVNGMTVKS
jgi:hyperosmotically inducible protein